MNSQKAKKARDKQQKSPSCKHYFTNSDVKVMDRWISLLPKCKMRLGEEHNPMEGWDLTSRLFQSGPYSGSKMFEINRLVNSVSNWKTLTGKECSYMDRVLDASFDFVTWAIVHPMAENLTRKQRETMEAFRNRIDRNRGIGIPGPSPGSNNDGGNDDSSSSSNGDFF